MAAKILLRDLEIGDKFYPKSKIGKATPIFKVTGNCDFNGGYGSSTRVCLNLHTDKLVNKSCRLEIVKTQ